MKLLPDLYIFNPTCEAAIANGTVSYSPNKTLARFEKDLAYLPSILAQNKDLVLMDKYEDLSHIELLHSLSFPTPGQILQSDFLTPNQKIISELNHYKLWGWAPNWIHRLKKPLDVPKFQKSSFYNWDNLHKEIHSRNTAKNILESILTQNPNTIYIPKELKAQKLKSEEDIEVFLTQHKQIVLKEPWSSSGKGVLMLRKNTLNSAIKQRIKSILKQQTYLMGEPLLNKLMDMSMHFEIKNKEILYRGESYFKTNSNGQYRGNYLNCFPDNTDAEIIRFVETHKKNLQTDLKDAISQSPIPLLYEGNFGVDIMLVKINNQIKFQPCVEINLRNNMGTIALQLQKIIHPEAKGILNIVVDTKVSFEQVYKEAERKQIVENNRILKGTLPLVSTKEKRFGAFINLA